MSLRVLPELVSTGTKYRILTVRSDTRSRDRTGVEVGVFEFVYD